MTNATTVHPGSTKPLRVGFMMDQIAGHVTNYLNLRRVTDGDTAIEPKWCEIEYYREGGRIERTRERFLPFVPTYFSGNARGALELRRALHGADFDVIFTNTSIGVFFGRTFARTPTLIDFDSTPVQLDQMEAYTPKVDPRPVAQLKWQLCRHMFHSAALLQAWSHWARDSAIADYGVPAERIVVNPPGVDLDQWRPSPEARGTRTGPPRVLFVGGDFRRKGGDLLLEWMRHRQGDPLELHVVTREEVTPTPGVVVHHNVEPNSERLKRLYADADLFVLPSLGECFGIATIEAMAAGLPVIASDVGGTADIIEPGVNGFIVPGGDINKLGAAIETIVGDEALRTAMAMQSRLLAEQRFDVGANARRTLDFLRQIARPQDGDR
jgi:glycosyltransferase involved in cell wall biosynthesis